MNQNIPKVKLLEIRTLNKNKRNYLEDSLNIWFLSYRVIKIIIKLYLIIYLFHREKQALINSKINLCKTGFDKQFNINDAISNKFNILNEGSSFVFK